MKVFADATGTSFFKTDDHVKNLQEIEINTIQDFIYKYSLDSHILLGIKCWMIKRFDELLPGSPVLDSSDEPELHGDWVEIDFVSKMNVLDILVEIAKYEDITYSMEDYKNSGAFRDVKCDLDGVDDIEKWTLFAWDDSLKLEITKNSEGKITTRVIENEL